jgi:hypothetical protein
VLGVALCHNQRLLRTAVDCPAIADLHAAGLGGRFLCRMEWLDYPRIVCLCSIIVLEVRHGVEYHLLVHGPGFAIEVGGEHQPHIPMIGMMCVPICTKPPACWACICQWVVVVVALRVGSLLIQQCNS